MNLLQYLKNNIFFFLLKNDYINKNLPIPTSLRRLLHKKNMSLRQFLCLKNTLDPIETMCVWDNICDWYTENYVNHNFIIHCICRGIKCMCSSHENRLKIYGLYLLDKNKEAPRPLFSLVENKNLVKAVIYYIDAMERYHIEYSNTIAHVFLLELLVQEERLSKITLDDL